MLSFNYINSNKVYSNKEILKVAYPVLISLLMEQLIGMTDTAFLGRVGEVELGAAAIAGVFYLAVFMIGFGFSIGAQILIARRNGEGNYKATGDIFFQGIYFMLFLSILAFLITKTVAPYILRSLISSANIYEAAVSYIDWRVCGLFFSFVAVMFRAFFVGTTQTKTLTMNSVFMVLSNILFNYILVFGKFGFPALGIAGAAIGSSLAELVSVLFFVIYTILKIDVSKYGLNVFRVFSWKSLNKILNVSFWTMIQNFISLSTWFLFFMFIEHLGERPLAITNIIRNISGLLFMIVVAFASTCSSLVSNQIGAGNAKGVLSTVWQHVMLAYMIVIPLSVLFAIFPTYILGVYTNMSELIQDSIPSLWVFCLTPIVIAPGNIFFQSVSGTGNTKAAFVLEFITLVFYTIYIYILIGVLKPDVAWCWTSEFVYGTVLWILCYRYIKYGKWIKKTI